MALSHVFMWKDKYGYQPVTVDEAVEHYTYTVSAKSKLFICGICGQGVTLTAGEKKIRHFRHDQAAQNKECEDRSQAYEYSQSTNRLPAKIQTLPLRLIRESGHWRLELGLLALQETALKKYGQKLLCILNSKGKKYKYNLIERLYPNRLTWVNVGEQSSEYFQLFFSDGSSLPPLWPQRIDGLDDITLFEAETGRRLPFFTDVEVAKEYLAVIRGRFDPGSRLDVRADRVLEHGWHGYDIYRVQALRFSKEAASFFIRLKANLKKQVPLIFPLWPVVIRTPHLIYHDADELFVFLGGEGIGKEIKVQAFPSISLVSTVERETARLIRFACGIRKQMVSGGSDTPLLQLGRFSHPLHYDYFIRQSFDQTASLPKVTVTDHKGNELEGDWLEGLRPGTRLYVKGPFDGEVWLQSGGSPLVDRRTLKGGEDLELKAGMGQTLVIFQGLDCVRTIVFARPGQKRQGTEAPEQTKNGSAVGWTDTQLCRRLRRMTGDEVEASRPLAEFIHFFRGWRSVEMWLRQRQAKGNISKRAKTLLYTVMQEKEKRGKNNV
ncbi:hypothetical protein [Desulfovibrio sp. ZJ200]|uniref:hypothetical protein n=1 Tax=Desulfovibrio sp. ZJ200 TaxID=2709792 RepID=UPI0013ED80F2|nr:hypothetical protein [Desulfovibrio sp. ZJ200]